MPASPQFAPAACSLGAVFIWGTSDFTGGYASRRANAFVFTAASHAFALALMVAIALAQHAHFPSRTSVLWALLAGGIGGFSLAIFYRALAEGKMGLTAPIAALLSAAIPTLADIAIEGAPRPWTFAGFALAIVAIWLITRAEPVQKSEPDGKRNVWGRALLPVRRAQFGGFSPSAPQASSSATPTEPRQAPPSDPLGFAQSRLARVPVPTQPYEQLDDEEKTGAVPKGVAVAALAGVGFAAFYLCIRQAGSGSPLWIAAVSRAASFAATTIAVIVTKAPLRLDLPRTAMAAVAGSFDITGSALFIFASQHGRLDEAVVISSLYPAVTVILARLILKEHFSRWRWVGLLAALAAVPMIAAG
ncbi:MAG TPA: DMT family transporter [Candidatus Sulfotelmatobacter sp.]|nr:DMT family transporter [Candidatus Sulfotelmatobacter sp.]